MYLKFNSQVKNIILFNIAYLECQTLRNMREIKNSIQCFVFNVDIFGTSIFFSLTDNQAKQKRICIIISGKLGVMNSVRNSIKIIDWKFELFEPNKSIKGNFNQNLIS